MCSFDMCEYRCACATRHVEARGHFQQLVLTMHLVEAGSFVFAADLYTPS